MKNKILENLWPIIAITSILIISLISGSIPLQIVTSITGVIYVLLIAKENKYGYLFGIINVILYAYLSYIEGLYGTAILNILFSLPLLIYGIFSWSKKNSNNSKNTIKKMNDKEHFNLSIAIILFTVIIYIANRYFTDAMYPDIDAIICSLSFFGNFLMAKKYIEEWYMWLIVNLVNFIFWLYLVFSKDYSISMCSMWLIYLINTIYGIILWNKKIKKT